MKNISILGSTGSIGMQTIEVLRSLPDIKVLCLSANSNIKQLEAQIREFRPQFVSVYDEKYAKVLKQNICDTATKVYSGLDGLIKISQNRNNDLLIVSMIGINGIIPVLEAIKLNTNVAIATKEILVVAGKMIMDMAKKYGTQIIPIDSEHCAISQCLKDDYKRKISRLILTASGGPFRGKNVENLKSVTIEDALKHPNWQMGRKITIDSATLMNKGLEVIEARWLFDIEPSKIDVIIHPQSIIHSMVEYIDGSILAHLSNADMKIPIHYAVTYPDTNASDFGRLDLVDKNLSFESPDRNTFKTLDLAYNALKLGGTMPAVLNCSNEYAVKLFLEKKISFLDIQELVSECMDSHRNITNPNIKDIFEADIWSKIKIQDIVH